MLSINAHFVVSVACVGGVSKDISAEITVTVCDTKCHQSDQLTSVIEIMMFRWWPNVAGVDATLKTH